MDRLVRWVAAFTTSNPHTPLEMVFYEPAREPDVVTLLGAAQLDRPHYLDNDLRLLYREPGNRAMQFTVVSRQKHLYFEGPMQRQVFWWTGKTLPSRRDLDRLSDLGLSGVLIDSEPDPAFWARWQDRTAALSDEVFLISFAHFIWQKRWIMKTQSEDYYPDILP